MNVEDFLKARANGLMYYQDLYAPGSKIWEDITKLVASVNDMIELHKSWPVLLETQPEYQIDRSDLDTIRYSMIKHTQWLTQQEYIDRFGTEPPTAPILRKMAQRWSDHPDFDRTWSE